MRVAVALVSPGRLKILRTTKPSAFSAMSLRCIPKRGHVRVAACQTQQVGVVELQLVSAAHVAPHAPFRCCEWKHQSIYEVKSCQMAHTECTTTGVGSPGWSRGRRARARSWSTSSPLKKCPAAASRSSPWRRHARRAVLSGQEGRLRRPSVAFLATTKIASPRDGTFSTGC